MTKSNDQDLWLGGEGETAPKAKPKASKKLEAEGDEATAEDVAKIDSMAEMDAAENQAADTSDDAGSEATDKSSTEFVPTVIPELTHRGGFNDELYNSRKGSHDATLTPQSEATFVPSEPKIYVAPKSPDEVDEPKFGFPEVAADTQRLFIAIEIPRAAKREFSELANSFRPREYDRVRWIGEDAMHLTLKFLGDTPNSQIEDIKIALERAASSTGRFSIKIGRTGCFPSFVDPRICWVGFTGELRRLEQLQGRVEGGLVALGLEEDDREFRAHITVGRTRPGIRGRFAEDIGLSWQHAPLRSTGDSIPVNTIALYRSFLDDKNDTQYQQLVNFELG